MGELDRRSPRRWPLIVALGLFPMLTYFAVQLPGAGLPKQPEPQAIAAEKQAQLEAFNASTEPEQAAPVVFAAG